MLPATMKALVKERAGPSFVYKEVPLPAPQGDELLVKVGKVALCGSDINLYEWNNVAQTIAKAPFTPGHEMVGEIVGVGPDVPPEYAVGRRVCVENHFYCGHCYQCTHDQRHICQHLNQFGHGKGTIYGGCSEYTIIPAKYAYLLKTSLSDSKAAILEPCGVAHQAIEEINPNGEDILIQGCGAVGLFGIGIARAMGATKILATDIVEARLELAKKVGADVTINCKTENLKDAVMRETDGNGVGRLMEATGAAAMLNNCFPLLRKGGHVVLVGLPKSPVHVEHPLEDIVFKSLTLKTIHGRKIFHTWEETERLVFENLINTDVLMTHDFPLSQYEEARYKKQTTTNSSHAVVLDFCMKKRYEYQHRHFIMLSGIQTDLSDRPFLCNYPAANLMDTTRPLKAFKMLMSGKGCKVLMTPGH